MSETLEPTPEELAAAAALKAKAAQQTAVLSSAAAISKALAEALADASGLAQSAAAVGLTTATPPVEGALAGTLEGLDGLDVAGLLQGLAGLDALLNAEIPDSDGRTVRAALLRFSIASR